jgi:hypothetical protein
MPRLKPTMHDDLDLPNAWRELSPTNQQIHALVDEYKRLGLRQVVAISKGEKLLITECKKRIKTKITNLLRLK